jgi:hypothetical protein
MVLLHNNPGRAQVLYLSDRRANGAIKLPNHPDLRRRSIARLRYNDSRFLSNSAQLHSFPHRNSTVAQERGVGEALTKGETAASTVAAVAAAIVDKSERGDLIESCATMLKPAYFGNFTV